MPSLVVALLTVALQQPAGPDSLVALAKETLRPLTDSIALHKAGYFSIGFGGNAKDLSPFQGQHWLAVRRFLLNEPSPLEKPMFLMYLPLRDSLIPIGVAQATRVTGNAPPPTELAGVPAEWHVHVICRGIPGEGQVIADGVENCLARGGDPGPNRISMVHTWTVPNPDGPFAHDNPALPFIANGLRPPTQFTRDDRLFAIALGESYGARLMQGALIERYAIAAGKETKLGALRASIREATADLVSAERAGDAKRYAADKQRILATWKLLADEYRAVAATPQIRTQFDVELEGLLGSDHHHHGNDQGRR